MRNVKRIGAALGMIALLGTMPPHGTPRKTGSFKLTVGNGPYIAGSRIFVDAEGMQGSFTLSVLGPGTIEGREYVAPNVAAPASATLIGAARGALAYSSLRIVPPPAPGRPLLAVTTYENGIALHDPKTFALIGYASIGGPPGDVAFTAKGDIVAADTDGDTLTYIARNPWSVKRIGGVSEANEIELDKKSGDIFVSDRDAGPSGALTRITRAGDVSLVPTGNTAEGLTIDESRQIVYVGNVNEDSVAAVDARTMRVLRKIPSVPRTFGIALDPREQRLFVVSNESPGMNSRGGYVAVIDARSKSPRILRRSATYTFPLGIAYDAAGHRVFVTDEAANVVYVLSAKTLAPLRRPLATCRTPWRPRIAAGRLYVPCAHDNRVDVFALPSLRRVAGAPFATGGFPLSVALWP